MELVPISSIDFILILYLDIKNTQIVVHFPLVGKPHFCSWGPKDKQPRKGPVSPVFIDKKCICKKQNWYIYSFERPNYAFDGSLTLALFLLNT